MARITDRNDWFELWCEDRESMLTTMVRNMAADLDAGLSYFGNTVSRQRKMIEEYKAETDATFDMFKGMDEVSVNRWCFYELKKRGAIA